jgi:hypothetical protein
LNFVHQDKIELIHYIQGYRIKPTLHRLVGWLLDPNALARKTSFEKKVGWGFGVAWRCMEVDKSSFGVLDHFSYA